MRRTQSLPTRIAWLALPCLMASGCRTDGALQAALHGDLQTLRLEIREAQQQGRLDRDALTQLAQAVAGREVRSAQGDPAVRRLRTVRACAAPLYPVLEDRATRPDDAGAEAALILLEYNRIDKARAISEHAESASGSWRAVAARGSIAPSHSLLRRKFFEDPDERVRRAALHAAVTARDPGDLTQLLEAARLDPDPLSRSLATRAVGAIGGKEAVLRLGDRWARADEDVRAVIIEAWAMPRAFQSGGERELVRIAETETGQLSLAAAHALYRLSNEFGKLGAQVLAHAIADGTRQERQLAIRLASIDDPELRSAVVKASNDADPHVKLMAHAKLVNLPEHRKTSLEALQKLAKSQDSHAIQARAALAAAGDASIAGSLNRQLESKSSEHRKLAARGLLRLGRYPDVATALADENPDVRTSVACDVLANLG